MQYTLFVVAAYAIPLIMGMTRRRGPLFWLPWLSLPLALRLLRIIWTARGAQLNAGLKGTGRLHLLFGILFALALLWPAREPAVGAGRDRLSHHPACHWGGCRRGTLP